MIIWERSLTAKTLDLGSRFRGSNPLAPIRVGGVKAAYRSVKAQEKVQFFPNLFLALWPNWKKAIGLSPIQYEFESHQGYLWACSSIGRGAGFKTQMYKFESCQAHKYSYK